MYYYIPHVGYKGVDIDSNYIQHHGVKGQKWGVRRSQAELGYRNNHHSKTDRLGDRERTVFISGSSKTQNRKSGYYLKELPEPLKNRIRKEMEAGSRILVGDAPGIDTQVQKFLAQNGYKKVDVYSSDPEARINADADGKLGWNVKLVDSSRYEEGSKDARATKDKAMSTRATAAIAVVIPDGSSATRNNVNRMLDDGKEVNVFQLGDEDFMDVEDYKKTLQHSELYLMHHGIKGQRWGIKNGPPYPLDGEQHKRRRKINNKYADDVTSMKKKRKTLEFNVDKWGTDKDHNILYITGLSGSGKSTLAWDYAKNKSDRNTDIIHLDLYYEKHNSPDEMSQQFNKLLDKKVPDWRHMSDPFNNKTRKQHWDIVDRFEMALNEFGQEQYRKGRRVICEGVQLTDSGLYPDKKALKGKPVIIMKTNFLKSSVSSAKRDSETMLDFISLITDASRLKSQKMWLKQQKTLINEISHSCLKHGDYLMHHGIKGQKWGIKNGPPYPLKRYSTRVYKNNKQRINEIYKSMNRRDQTLLFPDSKPDDPFWKDDEYTPKSIAYSCVQSIKGKPVAFIVVGNAGNGEGDVGIGTRGDIRHQGSGYELGRRMVNWFNNQDNIRTIYWQPWYENTASIKLAEKLGFQKTNVNRDGWLKYKLEKENNKVQHSDYLMHHGIKGQRWGIKNGPPYPLATSQKTTREKKYSNEQGKKTPEEKQNLKDAKKVEKAEKRKQKYETYMNKHGFTDDGNFYTKEVPKSFKNSDGAYTLKVEKIKDFSKMLPQRLTYDAMVDLMYRGNLSNIHRFNKKVAKKYMQSKFPLSNIDKIDYLVLNKNPLKGDINVISNVTIDSGETATLCYKYMAYSDGGYYIKLVTAN